MIYPHTPTNTQHIYTYFCTQCHIFRIHTYVHMHIIIVL